DKAQGSLEDLADRIARRVMDRAELDGGLHRGNVTDEIGLVLKASFATGGVIGQRRDDGSAGSFALPANKWGVQIDAGGKVIGAVEMEATLGLIGSRRADGLPGVDPDRSWFNL